MDISHNKHFTMATQYDNWSKYCIIRSEIQSTVKDLTFPTKLYIYRLREIKTGEVRNTRHINGSRDVREFIIGTYEDELDTFDERYNQMIENYRMIQINFDANDVWTYESVVDKLHTIFKLRQREMWRKEREMLKTYDQLDLLEIGAMRILD